MKYTLLSIIMSLAIFIGGCDLNAEQRIAKLQDTLVTAQSHEADIDAYIAEAEATIPKLKEAMQSDMVPADWRVKAAETLADVQEGLAKAKETKAQVSSTVRQLDTAITQAKADGQIDWTDEALIYSQGIGSIAPMLPPPYAQYVALIASALSAGLGVFARKKSTEAVEYKSKYKAHRQGTEKTAIQTPSVAATLYQNIGEARKNQGIK